MTGFQSLNNFSFEYTGLRVWKACGENHFIVEMVWYEGLTGLIFVKLLNGQMH